MNRFFSRLMERMFSRRDSVTLRVRRVPNYVIVGSDAVEGNAVHLIPQDVLDVLRSGQTRVSGLSKENSMATKNPTPKQPGENQGPSEEAEVNSPPNDGYSSSNRPAGDPENDPDVPGEERPEGQNDPYGPADGQGTPQGGQGQGGTK